MTSRNIELQLDKRERLCERERQVGVCVCVSETVEVSV